MRFWTDAFAALGDKEGLEVSEEIVIGRRGGFVLDVVCGVVVHAVEIVRAFDESGFFGGEGGQTGAELFYLVEVSVVK